MFTKFFPLIFPAPVLEQVRQRLAVADKQVIDETITGFTYAMQAIGYTLHCIRQVALFCLNVRTAKLIRNAL